MLKYFSLIFVVFFVDSVRSTDLEYFCGEQQCLPESSQLPSDLKIDATLSDNQYVCLTVNYEYGLFGIAKKSLVNYCCFDVLEGNLCDALRKKNTIKACEFDAANVTDTSTTEPPARSTTHKPNSSTSMYPYFFTNIVMFLGSYNYHM